MEKQSGAGLSELNVCEVIERRVAMVAARFESNVAEYCNKKYPDGAKIVPLVCLKITENVILGTAQALHQEDKEKGLDFIKTMFNAAQQDAIRRWENT